MSPPGTPGSPARASSHSSRPAARDLLTFYAALAEYQRALAASARDLETLDVEAVVEAIPGFLAWLRQNGRSDLAASVARRFRGFRLESLSICPSWLPAFSRKDPVSEATVRASA